MGIPAYHIWKLNNEKKNFDIKWKIIDRGKSFNPTNRKCNLCLKEKYHIIFQIRSFFQFADNRCQQLLSNDIDEFYETDQFDEIYDFGKIMPTVPKVVYRPSNSHGSLVSVNVTVLCIC